MRGSRWIRTAGTAILVIATLAAVVGGLARLRLDTGMGAFLPADDATVQGLEQKSDDFGGDPVVALLETARPRTLFANSSQLMDLLKLEGQLARLDEVAAVYGPATVLNQTAGAAQDMMAQLVGRRDGYQQLAIAQARRKGLSPAQVKAVGQAATAAFDKRYAALLVEAMPAGLPTLSNTRFVYSVLFDDNGLPRPQWRFLVPSTNAVAILVRPRADLDQAAAARLTARVRSLVADSGLELSRSTVTGVPAIEAALTDRVRNEAPVLGGISLVVVGLVFLFSPWTRRRRDRLRPVVAAVLGTAATTAAFGWIGHDLSFGIVAFLPILLGIGSDFPLYLSRGGHDRRALVAALAAVVGFGSLAISPLPFVRELGIALAIGLTITVATALGLRRWLGATEATVEPEAPATPWAIGRTARVSVALLAVGVALAGWIVLPHLSVEADPEHLASGLPELDAATYAETMLRSVGEINIVVSGDDVASPAVLAWQRRVEDGIVRELGDTVHPVISTPDLFRFLGAHPTEQQVASAIQIMPAYLTSAVLRSDDHEAVMVFGVEFRDVSQLAPVLGQIRTAISDPPPGVTATVVGIPVSADRGLTIVSRDRLWMNLAGVVGAIAVLALGLRRRGDAVRGAATVLLATGWVTLIAWAATGALNPLTVAVGSLITATGCEFAIMLARGGPLRPVLTAAAAGTLGYLTLSFSELSVLRQFGLLLAAGVACSFAAAVLVNRVLLPERADVEPTYPAVVPEPQEVLV